ncbi:MAG TPA: UvrD-helicase domain-containing protein [Polyangiaceae bacterium]|nr:UvrD-helicase domain-containing protein [Polyangiaceae bacterium]
MPDDDDDLFGEEASGGDGDLAAPAGLDLNEPQARAVAHTEGPLLVFAGAGSGKTRVITYRIANLIARHHVPPFRLLAVTFTNKAAGEMRHRLEEMLGAQVREAWVGTFHATCARILRRYPEAAGLSSGFVIYDTQDQRSVMTRALRALDLDEKRYPARAMLGRVHKEKQEGRGPEDMALDSYMDEAAKRAYVAYEERMRAANAVDFEDLIWRVVGILEAKDTAPAATREARDALLRRFSHVLVDEFQDTNGTQYRLLRALAARTRNLCVVGDDDQSIYRWRGADVRNIRGFRRDYPDAEVVKLEQNYRSTANIVRGALGVIAPSATREPKELFTHNDEGGKVHVVETASERDEAAYVVRLVRDAVAGGVEPRNIAVFYRVHAQSRVLEEAMRAANLPYQVVGGMKFYERAEVKDALSYLRVLTNPKSDVDLLRVVNVPPRGIGKTTLDRLVELANTLGVSVFQAMAHLDQAPEIGAPARKRLGQVRALLSALAEAAREQTPAEALRDVLAKTGYRAALEAEDSAESDSRLENLAELEGSLADFAAECEARGERATVEGFLERVSLNSDLDALEETGRATLMTIHSAKGLEFDVVLVTGLEEDMFPYKGMDLRGDEELDEERRLAYVAVTRARQHLVLTYAKTRQIFGTTRLGAPSRFLRDLPRDVVHASATSAAKGAEASRYADAPPRARPSGDFHHPQARPRPAPPVAPGERYVDHDEADPSYEEGGVATELRRGARVRHKKFGVGQVVKTLELGEPAVVAFFPGWGEMKVLARFLEPG